MTKHALWARLGYIAIIAFATVAEPGAAATGLGDRLSGALSTGISGRDLIDALRNIVLFAGWGAVWTITSPADRAWPIVLRATASGLLLSAAAESYQLLSPTRTPSVLDLVTNTSGAMIGALGTVLAVVFLRAGRGRRSYVGLPMALFAAGYGGAVAVEAFSPLFRQERLPGLWGSLSERLAVALQNIEPLSAGFPRIEFILFVPAGLFAVAALAEFGVPYRNASVMVAAAGVGLAGICEVAHGMVGYPLYWGAILAHAAGIAVGAVLAVWFMPAFTRGLRGAERPLVLWWAFAFVIALWFLRPFSPEIDFAAIADKISRGHFVPLLAYRERMDVFSAADAIGPALQFVPLGALLAAWPMRRSGPLRGVLPGIYLVLILESLQILVAGRYFDITDAINGAAALALGWAIARRAGYSPYGEMLSADLTAAVERGPTPSRRNH